MLEDKPNKSYSVKDEQKGADCATADFTDGNISTSINSWY